MLNETNDKIRYTSFIFFLEKGYEATNIRDICKEVDIKPSSLYFYYKSKQELFLSIYDEIWIQKIKFLESIMAMDLKQIYLSIFNYHSNNILNEKYLLRYHLFPAEEINTLIKDRYYYWSNEENKILLDLINNYIDNNPSVQLTSLDLLTSFKKFMQLKVIEMITYNIKPSSLEQEKSWMRFWNVNTFNI